MNGSTRLCTAILGSFGVLTILGGIVLLGLFFSNYSSRSNDLELVGGIAPGIGALVTGALLLAASEGLRLLSEIKQGLHTR